MTILAGGSVAKWSYSKTMMSKTEHLPNFGNITEREKTILKEVVSLSLRLSFILEYYPEEARLLINNISSYYGRLQGNHQGAIPEVL